MDENADEFQAAQNELIRDNRSMLMKAGLIMHAIRHDWISAAMRRVCELDSLTREALQVGADSPLDPSAAAPVSYTPGPWFYDESQPYVVRINDCCGHTVAEIPYIRDKASAIANARLIAAAPDMMEVTSSVTHYFEKTTYDTAYGAVENSEGIPT